MGSIFDGSLSNNSLKSLRVIEKRKNPFDEPIQTGDYPSKRFKDE